MRLFGLGVLPWKQTQLVYHAAAVLGMESLIICRSREAYVCVGYVQNPKDALDLGYCAENNLPFFRRQIGGGTVLIDRNQILYSLVMHRDNPAVPFNRGSFFRKFLQPVVDTCREFGLDASFKPICDITVGGKKISGNGGGEIGDCVVLSGNILIDFDFETMARILKAPNEMWREMVHSSMLRNLTTIKKEIGSLSDSKIESVLISKFENFLGGFEDSSSSLNSEIINAMNKMSVEFSDERWMFQSGVKQDGNEIKIIEGIEVVYKNIDVEGRSLEVTFELDRSKGAVTQIYFSPLSGKISREVITRIFEEVQKYAGAEA
jgi:lipoate-protein ligase A